MFDQLTKRLADVFTLMGKKGKLSEENIQDGIRQVKLALLEADVNFKVVKSFISRVEKIALGEKVLKSITPAQQFIKIVHDQLVETMGGEGSVDLDFRKSRLNILLCGLQGSGKTTTAAKIALKFKKDFRFLLVSTDVYRPAAIQQLQVLAKEAGVAFFDEALNIRKPLDIVKKAKKYAEKNGYNGIIVDTAGRLEIDSELMKELLQISKVIDFNEVLFVADSTAGQAIAETVQGFHNSVELTGLVITKFDSDTRGGAALSVREVTGKPVKFTGTGEKIEDLELFFPERVASRILGQGDILSLVENAQEHIDEEDVKKLEKKIKKNKFDLEDFRDQIRKIKKMGSLSKIMEMLPGIKGKQANVDDKELIRIEAIINSMTPFERSNTNILNGSRRKRIATGSGTTVFDVNRMVNKFIDMKKMMKKFSKNPKLLENIGNQGIPNIRMPY